MIRIEEIEDEISKLEMENTSYQTCQKLAILYIVKDHIKKKSKLDSYSFSSSEFMRVVADAPIDGVMQILDEHMDCVRLLYPKEYDMLIKKIKGL